MDIICTIYVNERTSFCLFMYIYVCMCVCVRVCVSMSVRACVRVYHPWFGCGFKLCLMSNYCGLYQVRSLSFCLKENSTENPCTLLCPGQVPTRCGNTAVLLAPHFTNCVRSSDSGPINTRISASPPKQKTIKLQGPKQMWLMTFLSYSFVFFYSQLP